jgi:hypothetical protein
VFGIAPMATRRILARSRRETPVAAVRRSNQEHAIAVRDGAKHGSVRIELAGVAPGNSRSHTLVVGKADPRRARARTPHRMSPRVRRRAGSALMKSPGRNILRLRRVFRTGLGPRRSPGVRHTTAENRLNGFDRRNSLRVAAGSAGSTTDRRVIVLGLEGMDPTLILLLATIGRQTGGCPVVPSRRHSMVFDGRWGCRS